MKTISKKEIRGTIEDSLSQLTAKFYSAEPSKATKKFMQSVSKKLATHIKDDVKKNLKGIAKTIKASKKKKSTKKTKKKADSPVVG